jgi:TonB family protein
MKTARIAEVAVVVCLLLAVAQAQDKKREEANQLLRAAYESSCLTSSLTPYEMVSSLNFEQLVTGNAAGSLHRNWADEKNVIQAIRVADYQMVTATKDGKHYRFENLDFMPAQIAPLLRLAPPFCLRLDDTDIVKKISNRKVDGVEARCIAYDTVRGRVTLAHEACVQTGVPGVAPPPAVLLSYRENEKEYRWSGYESFDGRMLPEHMEMFRNGSRMINGAIRYADWKPGAEAIVLPEGIKEVPTCRQRVMPLVKSQTPPIYPLGAANQKGLIHEVTVDIKIGVDGKVKATQLVETGSKPFDDAALEAVKNWTFSPSMCDGKPDERQIQVTVKFHRF